MDSFLSVEETSEIPVYFVSARARPELIEGMKRRGIAGFVTKPIGAGLLNKVFDKEEPSQNVR